MNIEISQEPDRNTHWIQWKVETRVLFLCRPRSMTPSVTFNKQSEPVSVKTSGLSRRSAHVRPTTGPPQLHVRMCALSPFVPQTHRHGNTNNTSILHAIPECEQFSPG